MLLLRRCVHNNLFNFKGQHHHSIPKLWKHFSMSSPNMEPVSAGILIIGDEILKGQVVDTNTHFLTQKLYQLGVKVEKIAVIPDQVDVIAKEVQVFSDLFTYVLTSGGIGPTHDDVTFEAIAKAFGDHVVVNEDINEALKIYFKTENLTEGMIKLATIPSTAKLNFSQTPFAKDLKYPLVSVKNVYIFPGIPELLRKAFNHIGSHIFDNSALKRTTHEYFLTETEVYLASKLNGLVAKYPDVVFGSYPAWVNNYFKVKLTVEAQKLELLEQIGQEVKVCFPVLKNFDKEPHVDSMEKLLEHVKKVDSEFSAKITESLNTIKECFERFKLPEVVVAFNGGKDCIVILHLVHAFLRSSEGHKNAKIQVLLVKDEEPFKEVTQFVEISQKVYNLDVITVGRPMKEGLQTMLDQRPAIKSAILGTRSCDPSAASLGKFTPTDPDWPSLMRVSPILNWSYSEIWTFIRGLNLPYPSLYDCGYTSLGDRRNTLPNPSLEIKDDGGSISYKPAYLLDDDTLERTGRQS